LSSGGTRNLFHLFSHAGARPRCRRRIILYTDQDPPARAAGAHRRSDEIARLCGLMLFLNNAGRVNWVQFGQSIALRQQCFQHCQGPLACLRTNFGVREIAEPMLLMNDGSVTPGRSDVDEPDRISVLVRFRSGDTCDCDGDIGGAALERSERHRFRDLLTYRRVASNQRRLHAERLDLVLFRVDDKTAVENLTCAWSIGEESGQRPRSAGFRRCQSDPCFLSGFDDSSRLACEFV
jgi:hypothetical protein